MSQESTAPAVSRVDPPSDSCEQQTGRTGIDLAQQVRRGAAWSMAGTLILRLATIAITAVVARLVTPREFGVFAVVIAVHSIISSISELGISSCLMRGDTNLDDIGPTVVTISIVSSTIFAVVMFVFARPLSIALGSVAATGPMRVMTLTIFMTGLVAAPNAQLIRDFRQFRLFLANAVSLPVSSAVLVFLAAHGDGAMAFAWSRVIGQLVVGLILVMSVSRLYLPGFNRAMVAGLLGFGLPLAGANLLNYALLNADYVIVSRLLGSAELGIYMLAFNVASWSTSLLGSTLNAVAMPVFSRVRDDSARLRHLVHTAATSLTAVALPVAAMTLALSRPLVLTLYGDRWSAASPVLAVLGLYGAVFVLCLLLGNVLVGISGARPLFIVQVVWILALVPALVIGVRTAGVMGAGVAHVVVVVGLVLPIYLVAFWRVSGIGPLELFSSATSPMFASVAAGLAAFFSASTLSRPFEQLLVGTAVGGVIYLTLVAPGIRPLLLSQSGSTVIGRTVAYYCDFGVLVRRTFMGLVPRRRFPRQAGKGGKLERRPFGNVP